MVNNKLFCQYIILNSDRNILRQKIEENFNINMSNVVTDEEIYYTLISLLRKEKDEAFKKIMTFHPDILRYERVFLNGDKKSENIIEKSQKTEQLKDYFHKFINIALVIDLSLLTALMIKMLFEKK